MTLTDGALYDDYEQKCDECRRLRERIKELEANQKPRFSKMCETDSKGGWS